jgi:hypothetical protein
MSQCVDACRTLMLVFVFVLVLVIENQRLIDLTLSGGTPIFDRKMFFPLYGSSSSVHPGTVPCSITGTITSTITNMSMRTGMSRMR